MLNPYVLAKMSVDSVNCFTFPRLAKQDNKYQRQFQDGVKPADWVMKMHKQCLVDIAKKKGMMGDIDVESVIKAQTNVSTSNRNIDMPSLLTIYCNMVELMRLRHEIILTVSECKALEDIYKKQAEQCRKQGFHVSLPDGISFEIVDTQDDQSDVINYFDEGTSHNIKIDLAVREYDACMLSNFNFRNPDTFKINITSSGLEEVRSVLTYQLLQKHLLVVATRTNQLMMDNSMKANSELNLLQAYSVATPNSTFDINSVISTNADNLST